MKWREIQCVIAMGCILLMPALAGTALAETPDGQNGDEVLTVGNIVVSARGTDSLVSETPGGVGLLEKEKIFQEQPVSVTNALGKYIPGVDKSSDSAWGSAMNIRGLGRNRVVFLIDGCRVNTATDINAQFGLIDPMEIERVEVLKGPISALYGSGSIGGVVNIITKNGALSEESEFHGTLMAGGGSNPEGYRGYGNISYNSQSGWVYASAGGRDYDSYEDGDGDEIHNSQWNDASFNLKSGFRWNESNVSGVQIQRLEAEDVGIPGRGLALPEGPDITYPDTMRTLVQGTHRFSPAGSALAESDLNIYYQSIERRVLMEFPEGMPMDTIRPEADHETIGGKWLNRFDLGAHLLTVGIDVWNWGIESERTKNLSSGMTGIDTPLADAEQLSAGLVAENDWHLNDRFVLNIGGRVDYIHAESDELYDWIVPPNPAIIPTLKRDAEEQDDTSWGAHAGLTWNLASDWSMTFIGASSYRTPDLMDRYKYIAFTGGETYGNPDLDPERSLFFEYGVHYTSHRLSASAAAYLNNVDDLITEQLVSSGLYQMENIEEARIYGGELEATYNFTQSVSAYGYVAYTRGTNETNDENLPFIAPLNGLVGVAYQPALGFRGSIDMLWAAEQDEVSPDETETPGWATFDAQIGYRFKWGNTVNDIVLACQNLFDTEYRNHLSTSRGVDLNEPGRNISATLKLEF